MSRFIDEVQAMRMCSDIHGILPVLDASPDAARPPWFVMGLAVPLQKALAHASLHDVVSAVASIAETLATMHARGVAHRDVKPENLFKFNGQWAVGDFGLADFEGKQANTAHGEKIGPLFYIAPEMLNDARSSDGTAADVYSIAKTLWVLASGQKFPLPGQLDFLRSESLGLRAYVNDPRAALLEQLLMACTDPNPKRRPSAADVARELRTWLAGPPQPQLIDSFDLSHHASELAIRAQRVQAAEAEKKGRSAARSADGRRVRDAFRPFVLRAAESLRRANFLSVTQDIDKHQWGFELWATVPSYDAVAREPLAVLKIKCDVNCPLDDPFDVEIKAYAAIRNGSLSKLNELWTGNARFEPGGALEASELSRLTDQCMVLFPTWVDEVVRLSQTL